MIKINRLWQRSKQAWVQVRLATQRRKDEQRQLRERLAQECLVQGELVALLDRARQLLPPDLALWSKTCKERAFIGAELVELSVQYSALQAMPAWQHYQGLLHNVRLQLEKGILMGVVEGGVDKTSELRSAYGMLLQLEAIPEQIKSKILAKEYEAGLEAANNQEPEEETLNEHDLTDWE